MRSRRDSGTARGESCSSARRVEVELSRRRVCSPDPTLNIFSSFAAYLGREGEEDEGWWRVR